jgi:mannan endo-1,4-beta-mannosidase
MKSTSGKLFLLSSLIFIASPSLVAQPIDPDATTETKILFDSLNVLRRDHLLFGHQHTTEYGIGWQAVDTNDSDVKRTTGAFPAVYGWDFFEPQQTTTGRGPTSMYSQVLAAHGRGGINTFSWHYSNPVTGGNFYDTTPAVPDLLPGGGKHTKFCEDLDAIADFLNNLKDESGALVPVIFRPWHEHNGKWFWWGTPHHCTPEQFIALWRFTVDYLRVEKGVHNVLYAWSPSWSWKDEYFVGYPGDDYVDIFGVDIYVPLLKPCLPGVRRLVRRAGERGKIPALTEAGYPDGLSKCTRGKPFTEDLLAPLRDDPVAKRVTWVLVWRNGSEDHLWVPPPEHPFAEDFRAFYRDSFTVFGDTLPDLMKSVSPPVPDTFEGTKVKHD